MSLRDQDNHSEVVEIRPDQFQVAYRDGISKEFRKELGVEALKPDDETDPSINLDSADRHLKIALVRRVDELMLSVRTLNCLQSHHCEYVGDVVCLMESQLLCLPNFGRKSLKELRNTLKHLGLQMGCSIKGWNYETAEELRRELENEIHESLAIDFQPQCCSEQQTLEDELIAIAKVVASNRNVEIITSYWGWSGNGQRTLESVGQEHGITRERVRQIVAKAEKKLKKLPLPCPKLKEAASYLENRAPEFENVLGDALASAGIADSAFQVSGVITAIRIMGVQSSIQLTRIEHLKIMISSGDTTAKNIKSLLKLVRSLSRIQGCVNIDDILERSTVDNKKIRKFFVEVVNCHSDLSWLSDDKKWLWPVPYEGMKKNRLINFIQKIFSVAQSLHISELRQGLSRHHRLVFAPPSRVLLEICRQLDFLEVKGSQVETTSGETLPSTLSWLETVLIKAFNGKPLLSREALETNALALGMNRSSFYVMIGYSVVVARLSKGVYAPIGAEIPPGAVEATKPSFQRNRVVVDFGWNASRYLWIAYHLSEAMIRGGQANVPTSVKEYIQGQWLMESTRREIPVFVVVRNTQVLGLQRILDRSGAEYGDILILVFDTKDHLFRMELGGDELVERWQNNEFKITDDQLLDLDLEDDA